MILQRIRFVIVDIDRIFSHILWKFLFTLRVFARNLLATGSHHRNSFFSYFTYDA